MSLPKLPRIFGQKKKLEWASSLTMRTPDHNPSEPGAVLLEQELDVTVLNCAHRYELVFKQAVTTEDVFLGMGLKNPATASCEDLVVCTCVATTVL